MSVIDRRRFLQTGAVASGALGAAWVAPSVLGTSSAFADTSPSTCPSNESLAFVGGKTVNPWPTQDGNGVSSNAADNNGWTFTQADLTGTDALGVFANYHAPPPSVPQFVVERNPNTSNIGNAKVTYTHTLGPLSTTTAYTFTSQIIGVKTNQYTQLLDVQILDAGSNVVATLGRYRTDSSSATNNTNYTLLPSSGTPQNPVGVWTTYPWTFTPSVAGTYQIRFSFTFTAAGQGANTGGNNGVGDDIAVTAPTIACA